MSSHPMGATVPKVWRSPDHEYFLEPERKIKIPGFSEIVRDLGIVKDNPYWTDAGREEGTILHAWLLFLAQGKEPSIPPNPRIAGRVQGIRKFLEESKFKLSFGEEPQYDPVSCFACTPDLIGYIGALQVNIDAKRGDPQKWHVLQLTAQKIALASGMVHIEKSFGLYLRDGDYRLVEQDTRKHETKCRAIVSGFYAKKEYIK